MSSFIDPVYIALAAVALAGLVHGTLGVGFPLVATPLIALATDVKTAILLTLAPTLIVNLLSILRGGGWRESVGRFWPVALLVLIGSIIGTRLLIVSDPAPFKLVLAAVIAIYLFTSTEKRRSNWVWVGRYPLLSGAFFGSLGGLMAGTVNVAVPALIIYFSEMHLKSVALVQAINLCFLGGKAAQIVTFAAAGQLGREVLLRSLLLAVVGAMTLIIGMKLRDRVDTTTYRRWLRYLLGVIAIVLAVQFAFGV